MPCTTYQQLRIRDRLPGGFLRHLIELGAGHRLAADRIVNVTGAALVDAAVPVRVTARLRRAAPPQAAPTGKQTESFCPLQLCATRMDACRGDMVQGEP